MIDRTYELRILQWSTIRDSRNNDHTFIGMAINCIDIVIMTVIVARLQNIVIGSIMSINCVILQSYGARHSELIYRCQWQRYFDILNLVELQ